MPKHSVAHFQECWLTDDRYKAWIKRATIDTKATCKLCNSDISIASIGAPALDSHSKSKKHADIAKLRETTGAAFVGEMSYKISFIL